jgi:hypothetical protein
MSELVKINQMPSTLKDISVAFMAIKQEILSGEKDPLMLEVKLKAMEELVKRLRSDSEIKEAVINEGMKHPEKTFEMYGASFSKTTVGVKYDFTGCNDKEYFDLKEQDSKLSAKLKEKETFLKSLKKSMADPDTGEIINPPLKYGKESLSVTIL